MQVIRGDGFSGWHALNDTVMGGRSTGLCTVSSRGLRLEAEVVEDGGGFVSCRSPVFSPPLDLSEQAAFELELRGDGRHYKLAVACADGVAGLTEMIQGGVRWVANFATEPEGPCRVRIPFAQLRASIRARPIETLPLGLPLRFDAGRITRLQILHSKFGDDGSANPGFRAGPLTLEVMAIDAVA